MTNFTDQNGWGDKLETNYLAEKHSIDGFYLQSRNAWLAGGKYYESGNLAGLIDTYLFKEDEPISALLSQPTPITLSKYPTNASSDYYAGVIFGWVDMDVKAEMDTCFPDYNAHAWLIENSYNAWDSGDWGDIMNAYISTWM